MLALVAGLEHHDALLIGTEIIAICVVPVACLPVAALVGIRWPYHPLSCITAGTAASRCAG